MNTKEKNIIGAILIMLILLFIIIILNFYYEDKIKKENEIKPKFENAPKISEIQQSKKGGYIGDVESIPEIKDLRTGEILQESKIIIT